MRITSRIMEHTVFCYLKFKIALGDFSLNFNEPDGKITFSNKLIIYHISFQMSE